MKQVPVQTDNVTQLAGADFNVIPRETENAIKAQGIALNASGSNVSQLAEAISEAVSLNDLYQDSGSANIYTLSPIGQRKGLTQYIDGMTVRFEPAVNNTGGSTVNVNSIGVKTIYKNGIELSGGEIIIGGSYNIEYDEALDTGNGGFKLSKKITDSNISEYVSNKNELGNPNFYQGSPDPAVFPPPPSPGMDYPTADTEVFLGWFVSAGGITGLSRDPNTGLINSTSGSIYRDVPKSGPLGEYTGALVASWGNNNGQPTENNAVISFADMGDYYRITLTPNGCFSAKFEQGVVASRHEANQSGSDDWLYFNSVAGMTGIGSGVKVKTAGYHNIFDNGGGEYLTDTVTVADGYADIDVGNGITAVLQGEVIDIRAAGCKAGDYAFDNAERIKSAVKKGRGVVPAGVGKFYASPIRFNTDYNGKSLVGLGKDSVLSLISAAVSGGVPLFHIPQNGGAYGGTEAGATDFFLDMLTLDGSDATATTSTVGMVVEASTNFTYGTVWSSGFYKGGGLITGATSNLTGTAFHGDNNGNQAGAATGGQGLAVSVDETDEPSVALELVTGNGNGLANFGQAFDAARGNIEVGTLIGTGNGSSCMKIVTAQKVHIKRFVSTNNNQHAGQTFASLYTNGDFGELTIDSFDSTESAGSSIAHVSTGHIHIGHAKINGPGSNGLSLAPAVGKVASLTIGHLEGDDPAINFINQTGDSHLAITRAELKTCPHQGVLLAGTSSELGSVTILDSIGMPLWLREGDITIVTAKISRTDLSGVTAVLIDNTVSNAAVLNLKTKGYSTPLADNGTATYKPNVVTL